MKASVQIFTLSAMSCLSTLQVNAHLTMVSMIGETNGYRGTSFGEMEGVPRNGTARFPFQADSGVIRQGDIDKGMASVCGRTLMGPIDMKASFQKAELEGLPDLAPGGRIIITTHQINADGGGPYTCAVDLGATGERFIQIPIEVNIPGANGRSDARAIDLPLVAKMPKNLICTGGTDKQTCLIRCMNGAKAGPFGGCLAFTQKPGAAENANPLPADADFFSPALEALKQKAQNEQITIMPIAKKVIPLNLTPNRRSLSQRQTQTPQLMVYPPAGPRITPTTTGTIAAPSTFGTDLEGAGVNNNNGGNGYTNNTKPPATPAPATPPVAKGKANKRFIKRDSYVAAKSATVEGTLQEIVTGPLGQADSPKLIQKSKDLKFPGPQYVLQMSE
ncbi:hypothetical protein PTTG_25854 [Puccinia triticina 1-1 BBBD Race 1]|uniref:Uncharacterized protein n=2 Tax=Puccinia triticina TaxID=208348 RepID=A0A180GZW9_PUCT1|nr:uncharacterized protein PtA15_15A384 [Puccinia triticina]OAV97868.1 hypothetical protein PTTG_25854 [Puccinia triticina 1-1 BBBD Race 1]WAQ91991.1 hypothetical protein PtA15_15A384 [Puccinia triticina]WAR62797.1 hypothetical protein PtB15_15B385 [Puccinia triticina]